MSQVSDSDFSWHLSQTDEASDSDSNSSEELSDIYFDSDESDHTRDEFDMLDTVFDEINILNHDVSFDTVTWSNNLQPVHVEEFRSDSGPCHFLNVQSSNEIDFFHLFFTSDSIRNICTETNRYAATFGDTAWYDVCEEELKSFIGLLIMMGIVRLPSYKLYWSQNSFLNNQGFVNVMPCNRFAKILQYLHINDVGNCDDPLLKLRPLLNDTLANIKACYAPKQHLSVDEGMVAFKGRHTAVQYNPSKPIRRGLKVWMLCDSQSGFCHNFQVRCSKHK